MWLKQASLAAKAVDEATGEERSFYLGKLQACQYFYRYELTKLPERYALLADADDTCLNMADDWF